MANEKQSTRISIVKSQEEGMEWMQNMLKLAKPESVFSEPVTAGEYTVVTASEAWAAMGHGFGGGEGPVPGSGTQSGSTMMGGGGGGGGGGVSTGRPVAAISIGPDGVRVEPILDMTKIVLALVSVLGSLLLMRGRMMRRMNRKRTK